MARTSLTTVALVALIGCGGAQREPSRPLAVADGWTATALDDVLERWSACAGGCDDVCVVEGHVEENGRARDVAHWIGADARAVVTVRSDGSVSARAALVRGPEALHATLEGPPGDAALDVAAALRALAHPSFRTVPEGALISRTYERSAETAYLLIERGGSARETRLEREERGDGVEQRAIGRHGGASEESTASIDETGRTRRTEDVHAREGERWRTSTTERIDAHARVVHVRREASGPDGRSDVEEHELEYDDAGELAAVTWHRAAAPPRRARVGERFPSSGVTERDAHGRAIEYRRTDDGVETVVSITRDAEGRVSRVTYRSRYSTSETLIERDPRGRVLRESSTYVFHDPDEDTTERGAWSRALTRTLDDRGRIVAADVVEHARDAERPERSSTTSARYRYGERCGDDVQVAEELELLPSIDDRVEYVPF
ncbi:hypothetical protein [Sandaracinus amylolyticus]|uniref:Uncharacterized protein n=1 Tax=Sandaracinus amylolyticus TaxID=927083 RepID=A0A0F6SEW7_9BACT|nr:hypothetical protein [Sandaracinus amylolyticus]AKF05914.1 hypothetical protein DB32_003063 [Sandaracinus amylolyticus]